MENCGFITMENYAPFLLVAIFFGTIIGWLALNKWSSHIDAKVAKEMEELESKPFGVYLEALRICGRADTLGIEDLDEEQRKKVESWLLKEKS